MNSKGQFLLYDILLAVFLLFIVMTCVSYVLGQEDDYGSDYSKPYDALNLLSSMSVHDENLLVALSEGDEMAVITASEVLDDTPHTLRDLSMNRTLSTLRASSYRDVLSARRIVEGHEYELTFYV